MISNLFDELRVSSSRAIQTGFRSHGAALSSFTACSSLRNLITLCRRHQLSESQSFSFLCIQFRSVEIDARTGSSRWIVKENWKFQRNGTVQTVCFEPDKLSANAAFKWDIYLRAALYEIYVNTFDLSDN